MQSQILGRMGTSCLCDKLPAWARIRATKNISFWSFLVFTLHLGEWHAYITWKSRCLVLNKLLSSSCCILGQTFRTCIGHIFYYWKNTIRNQFFWNFYPYIYLLLKSLLSKLLTPPSANKKNLCTALRLHIYDALSSILFQPITARSFSTAAPFLVLSILTMCFKDINLLIKMKLFFLKHVFSEKAFI